MLVLHFSTNDEKLNALKCFICLDTLKMDVHRKRPIIISSSSKNFYDDRLYDIRLKEGFKLFITGPSRSGKTYFIDKLLNNLSDFTIFPPKTIVYVYKVWQPKYGDMKVDYFIEDSEDLEKQLFENIKSPSSLVVFDDLINSKSLPFIAKLFTVDARHKNMSMVFVSQKMFVNNDNFRQISQNSDYYAVFKNPRNASEIRTLAQQMTPGSMDLVSYFTKATHNPYSYLFINFTQECEPNVKFLSDLFNKPHEVKVFNEHGAKILYDDNQTSPNTNFKSMVLSNETKDYCNCSSRSEAKSHSVVPKNYNNTFVDENHQPTYRREDFTPYNPPVNLPNYIIQNPLNTHNQSSHLPSQHDQSSQVNLPNQLIQHDQGSQVDQPIQHDQGSQVNQPIQHDQSTQVNVHNQPIRKPLTYHKLDQVDIPPMQNNVIRKPLSFHLAESTNIPPQNLSITNQEPLKKAIKGPLSYHLVETTNIPPQNNFPIEKTNPRIQATQQRVTLRQPVLQLGHDMNKSYLQASQKYPIQSSLASTTFPVEIPNQERVLNDTDVIMQPQIDTTSKPALTYISQPQIAHRTKPALTTTSTQSINIQPQIEQMDLSSTQPHMEQKVMSSTQPQVEQMDLSTAQSEVEQMDTSKHSAKRKHELTETSKSKQAKKANHVTKSSKEVGKTRLSPIREEDRFVDLGESMDEGITSDIIYQPLPAIDTENRPAISHESKAAISYNKKPALQYESTTHPIVSYQNKPMKPIEDI